MKKNELFSEDNYLFLPSSFTPKVALAVSNRHIAENAFKLYHPFSKKAKFLKIIASFLFVHFNSAAKKVLAPKKKEKSEFITFLESKFNKPITVSLYYATARDKVVLQIQSKKEIIGYLKYALNDRGIQHLKIENKAIEVLSKNKLVAPVILFDEYHGKPFLLLKELNGKIQEIELGDLEDLLCKFRKDKKHPLKDHPRIRSLQHTLEEKGLDNVLLVLKSACSSSKEMYFEVYEHGDFAPWNLIKTQNGIVPFDFEYFVERGLEYFDIIKYFYQKGNLLLGLNGIALADYIKAHINIPEIHQLLQLYIIKEIIRCDEEGEPKDEELRLLDTLELR